MNSQLAYEIGAVFLLAAMLMFGSSRGFGRFKLGGGTMIALGAMVLVFGVYHYWDQILALAASGDSAALVSAPAALPPAPPPARTAPAAPKHRSIHRPEPIEKIIVIEEVPAPERIIVQAPSADKAPAAEKPETPSAPDPCEKSPYESKARRALKSMGCGMHIIRKKHEPPDPFLD